MKRFQSYLSLAGFFVLSVGIADARDQISIVGSSTVYPFATVVAEHFGQTSNFKTPKIEATGSGGGLKLFCAGLGSQTPDMTNASRRIKQSEVDSCHENGVTEIIEVKAGYDGIVLANSKKSDVMKIGLKDIFLALAKDIPNPDGSESFVANPYKMWSDVNADLPKTEIMVLGPPPTSGTRDAFVELAMEGGCKQYDWIAAMKKTDKDSYKARCHSIREEGAYVETGENDNLIVQKLSVNPDAFGIFGFSFLEQNMDIVQGAMIGNVSPVFDTISDGSYPISRALYFYVKKQHVGIVPGIAEYTKAFVSPEAIGQEGYLIERGLIPMNEKEHQAVMDQVQNMEILSATL